MKALRLCVIAVLATGCLVAEAPRAADPDPHEADRKQLLALFAEVEAAINDQNVDRMLAQMDDRVTVVWLNAEVSRGKQEVKAYYGRMVGTEQAILKKYLTKATVGAPAQFYGDVAVADGSAADEFYPNARGVFQARLALVGGTRQEFGRVEDRLPASFVERLQQPVARRGQDRHLLRGGGWRARRIDPDVPLHAAAAALTGVRRGRPARAVAMRAAGPITSPSQSRPRTTRRSPSDRGTFAAPRSPGSR